MLGNSFNVVRADDQGDAADGVAAINKLLAIDQPVAVFGPSSDTATAVVPIINRSQVVDWCLCGTTQLDRMTWKYIYRPTPGDSLQGSALAFWAHKKGFTRAAFVFNSDTGSQTLVSPVLSTFNSLGGKASINIKLLPDQSSYRSEVQQVLNSHPQVIFSEMDPPTAATFFSEELQLGGKLLPSIQSDSAAGADFYNAIKKTVGEKLATTFITVMSVYSPTTPGSDEFLHAYHQVYPGQAPLEFNTNGYDAMNISALAMLESKSTTPSVWISKIASRHGRRQAATRGHLRAGQAGDPRRQIRLLRRSDRPHNLQPVPQLVRQLRSHGVQYRWLPAPVGHHARAGPAAIRALARMTPRLPQRTLVA